MSQADLNNLPIGVFDSGMGGLTVLKELKAKLPNESLIYLGDTARLPYGTKGLDTVTRYAKQMSDLLIHQNIKMLVIACNTATTAALPYLQQTFPQIPIVGVVEPGAELAVRTTKNNKILVLATETTIRSNLYELTIQRFNPAIEVINQACGLFVALTEEGCIDDELAMCAVTKYLKPVMNLKFNYDCVVLGCTHYPVLKNLIQTYIGDTIEIVDSAEATAFTVQTLLKEKSLLANKQKANYRFLVTDQPQRFARVSEIFFGESIAINTIELVDSIGSVYNSTMLDINH